ncbi:MAG TPA: DUF5916 domain-containing protein [Longimicrobiales bacterium]|nr:DUF5916 domain-containing protein [Longimicrobiales bacterium]
MSDITDGSRSPGRPATPAVAPPRPVPARFPVLVLALAGILAPGSLAAQDAPPPPVGGAVRAAGPVVVDGRLDEVAWNGAPALGGFVQSEPSQGSPASEETVVRVLYDDDALYVGAWLMDRDAGSLTLGETRRDAALDETDALAFVLDTYLDRQNGYVFGTTPAGIEYDGQVTKEGEGGFGGARFVQGSGAGVNTNWDGAWEVATTRDGAGWYAEFRIPFSTLRYGRGGEQRWGFNVVRRIRRKNEESFWAPIPRQFDLYRISMAGTLEGIQAPFRRSAQVTPYVLGSTRWAYLDENGDAYLNGASRRTDEFEVGGDAKLTLNPSLTLDLTVNTDFAQVEVDDQQVNLTRFNLFFPEKRPFFLENAGTFSVGNPQSVELFFSRRIGIADGAPVPILGGGRLTGRALGLNVGLLNIQTEEVQGVTAADNFGAARIFKEWENRTRLGGIFVSRLNTQDGDDYNLTYGLDGRLGIGESLTLDGYAALTETPGVSGGEHAVSVSADYTSFNWEWGGAFREVGEGFNPEVGFIDRGAYRFYSARLLRKYRFDRWEWFRELRPHVSYREYTDLDGFTETRLLHVDSHFEFSNGAFFQLPAVNFTREGLKEPFEISPGVVVPAGTYDHVEWGFRYNTDRSAFLSLDGRITVGGFYGGNRAGSDATLSARFGDTFVAGLRVDYNDVNLPAGDFETFLVGLRTAYSFTPRIYLQSLLQYNDRTDTFSANLRFGWLNTAGTGLFIVYNDLSNTETFERVGIPRGPLDRTLIVKFTRQFNIGG